MPPRITIPALCCFAGFAPTAYAKPPVIDSRQAVAGPRTDPATGVCVNVAHFAEPPMPLTTKAQAAAILDAPPGDPNILARTSLPVDSINFRNSQPGSGGDFQPPKYHKELFPYSFDPAAMPMGNDINIALRLRGYFNVPATLAGKTISFGLNCDDFCALNIGTTAVIPWADERLSARVIKQVTFRDAGLYPLELVYYQNGSTAYLEWSRTADSPVAECPNESCSTSLTDPAVYMGQFDLVRRDDLYSAITGASADCLECGATGMPPCPMGNYCGDGLCQGCATSDHCGASCLKCPVERALCSAGQCVECVDDSHCPKGQTCDSAQGRCLPPPGCVTDQDCPPGQSCNSETGMCLERPVPCTSNEPGMCPPGMLCDVPNGLCQLPPPACRADPDCGDVAANYCDMDDHHCKPAASEAYVGGQSGCGMARSAGQAGAAAGMLAMLGLWLVGLRFSRRRPAR